MARTGCVLWGSSTHTHTINFADIWQERGAFYGENGRLRKKPLHHESAILKDQRADFFSPVARLQHAHLVAADEVSRQLLGRAPRELLADDHIRAVGAFNVDAAEIT